MTTHSETFAVWTLLGHSRMYILGCTGGRAVSVALTSTDAAKVTCKRCIKKLEQAGTDCAAPVVDSWLVA